MAMCSNGLRSHNFNILLVSKDFKEVRKKTASCNIVSHNSVIQTTFLKLLHITFSSLLCRSFLVEPTHKFSCGMKLVRDR